MTIRLDGLVLAGGDSRRMGQDKGLLTHPAGGTWVEHARRTLLAAGCATVWISRPCGYGNPSPDDLVDLRPQEGPLAGIERGLNATSADYLAVLASDLVGAGPALFSYLAPHLSAGTLCVLPVWHEDAQPLAGYWSPRLLSDLERFRRGGDHRVRSFLAGHPVRWIPVPQQKWIANINTLEEWSLWQSGGGDSPSQGRGR